MKLPEELKFDPEKILYGRGCLEAIVRDCAKVCQSVGPKDGPLKLVSDGFAQAILKRYGLEQQ